LRRYEVWSLIVDIIEDELVKVALATDENEFILFNDIHLE